MQCISYQLLLVSVMQKQDRVDELQGWVERHKYHVQKLEVSRLRDNLELT